MLLSAHLWIIRFNSFCNLWLAPASHCLSGLQHRRFLRKTEMVCTGEKRSFFVFFWVQMLLSFLVAVMGSREPLIYSLWYKWLNCPLGSLNCNCWVNTYVCQSLKVRHRSGGQAFVWPQSGYCELLKYHLCHPPPFPVTSGRLLSTVDQRQVKIQFHWAVANSKALGIWHQVGVRIL